MIGRFLSGGTPLSFRAQGLNRRTNIRRRTGATHGDTKRVDSTHSCYILIMFYSVRLKITVAQINVSSIIRGAELF